MKKKCVMLSFFMFLVSICCCGCTERQSVSSDDYDTIKEERDYYKQEYEKLKEAQSSDTYITVDNKYDVATEENLKNSENNSLTNSSNSEMTIESAAATTSIDDKENESDSEISVESITDSSTDKNENTLQSIDLEKAVLGTWKGEVERINYHILQIELTLTEEGYIYKYDSTGPYTREGISEGTYSISDDILKFTADPERSEGENPPMYKLSYEDGQLVLIGGGARLANITTGGTETSNTYDASKNGIAESQQAYLKYKDPEPAENYNGSSTYSETSGGSTISDNEKILAWTIAKDEVKSRLKSPSTAKFPFAANSTGVNITKSGEIVTVRSYVDAENSFGATLRSNFTVKIRFSGTKYSIESCTID